MTILHVDGFNTYGTNNANMLRGVYAAMDTGNMPLRTTPLRSNLGTHCLEANNNAFGSRKVLDAAITEGVCGIAYYPVQISGAHNIFQLQNAANGPQITLATSSTGQLLVRLGATNGSIIASSANNALAAGTYQFVEMYFRIGNAGSPGGAVEVRVNGVTVIDETGLDTQAQADANVENVVIGLIGGGSTPTCYFQDYYITDMTGSINNGFLGDTEWIANFPNADTATEEFTPSTGTDSFAMIDDATPDDDSTYIESTSSPQTSIFEVENTPGTATELVAVVTRVLARKDSAGAANLQTSLISTLGSPDTEVAGSDNALEETYAVYTDVFETDPATGARWTKAAFDAMQLKHVRPAV